MRNPAFLFVLLIGLQASPQELFVSTDPASNIPARSASLKFSAHFVSNNRIYDRPAQRYIPEFMVGITKSLMVRAGATFSNMHTINFKEESFLIYAKYRFLSIDDVHKHFRMATFFGGSKTKAPFHYDEASLSGDKSGIEIGVIATQLWNKFALSGTISHLQILDKSRYNDVIYIPSRNYRLMNYAVSTGYLLFPKEYSNYKQMNTNLYMEMLAQQVLGSGRYFIDLAPAIQLIFLSSIKLNLGYRFQFAGHMDRMTKKSWVAGFEKSFLNIVNKRRKKVRPDNLN